MTETKPTMPDLLPCPFCGHEVLIEKFPSMMDQKWQVDCHNPDCKVSPCSNACRTEDEAREAWNRRVTPEQAHAAVDLETLKRECYALAEHQSFHETKIDAVIDYLAQSGHLRTDPVDDGVSLPVEPTIKMLMRMVDVYADPKSQTAPMNAVYAAIIKEAAITENERGSDGNI